jgi:hypothetical protein
MAWIKRNLYFVIAGAVTVILLGLAGWYLYSKWDLNNQNFESLNKAYSELKTLNQQPVHPGSGAVNNIQTAKEQTKELRDYIKKVRGSFQKIAPVPDLPKLTDHDFSFALSRSISLLRADATNIGVSLPPDFNFSFTAQSRKVQFPAGSLAPLAAQLGEVKAICDVLFQAKINALDFLRRERVSPDDATGSATDYLGDKSVTNELAVLTPYELTFRCFSPELAAVLSNFGSSPNGLIVKAINVEVAGATSGLTDPTTGLPISNTGQQPFIPNRSGEGIPGERYPNRFGPGGLPVPTTVPAAGIAPRGTLPTVLDERMLKITIALNVVKLLPPKDK